MARFTQEQIEQAKAEFFQEQGQTYVECSFLPGAGNNGGITMYKLGAQNGNDETASE